MTPALLTRMSSRPSFSTTASTTCWIASACRDIAGKGLGLAPGRRDPRRHVGELVGRAGHQGHRRAVGRQDLGDRPAEALRGARYEGHLAREIDLHAALWLRLLPAFARFGHLGILHS